MVLNLSLNEPIQNVAMSSLRPLTNRFRRRASAPTVESLIERLRRLALEREELRATDAGSLILERNRVAIAGAQWDLSYALIERYLPNPAAAAQSAA
jgi:hypothetical protein